MSRDTPLAGMRWSLELPDVHAQQHDAAQIRYWLAQPASARLAQAESYRLRILGSGPFDFVKSYVLLPPVVPAEPT